MLTGLNNMLEEAVRRNDLLKTDEDDSYEAFSERNFEIGKWMSMAVAAGEKWLVSADRLSTDEETRTAEAMVHCMTTKNGEKCLIAFTSVAAAERTEGWLGEPAEWIPAKTLLEVMLQNEEITALLLDPGEENDGFVLSRNKAKVIQEWAGNYRFSDMLTLMEYKMDPLGVIDTERIYREVWGTGLEEEGGLQWELDSYPILPDGSVMLNFTAKVEGDGELCRAVRLELGENGFAVAETYEADLRGSRLGTAVAFGGELWGIITNPEGYGHVAQKLAPWDEATRYLVYRDIHTVVWKPEGTPVVAYSSNMRDPQKLPLAIFNRDGEADWHRFELALECREVNLDSENNVWAYIFPSNCLTKVDEDGKEADMPVDLQGFNAFAMSSDKKELVTFFSRYGDECLIYVQHFVEGGYGNPVVFRFEPFDEEGNLLDITDCREYGKVSAMKDRFMLLVEGRLFYFSADMLNS